MKTTNRPRAMEQRFSEDDILSAINAVIAELAELAGLQPDQLLSAGSANLLAEPHSPAAVLSIFCAELGVEPPRAVWRALHTR